MTKALIIFIKNPEAGKVKTRLAATLGHDKALSIYNILVRHTIDVAENVDADRFVFYSSHIAVNDEWDNKKIFKRLQKGNDLGERMCNAFDLLFSEGYHSISIIGSDCPAITKTIIDEGFNASPNTDVVIGPAKDGGYYLMALKKINADLFSNILWSTNNVLTQTLAVCKRLNLSVHLLQELSDIDAEDDLADMHIFLPGKLNYD